MDDDEFMPLSITGISTPKGDISMSQVSTNSRLSRCYIKSRKKRVCGSKDINSCASSSVDFRQSSGNELKFCPVCQAPFDIMIIDPHVHADQCKVSSNELKECPSGEMCFSGNLFHYRDYAHKGLAQIRASKGHLSHEAQHTTPEQGNKGRCTRKQFSPTSAPLKCIKKPQRTSSNVTGKILSAHKKVLSEDEQTHSLEKDVSTDLQLQDGDEENNKTQEEKPNLNHISGKNAVRKMGVVNHKNENFNLKELKAEDYMQLSRRKSSIISNEGISKDSKFCGENFKHAAESRKSEGSKSDVLTAHDYNHKIIINNVKDKTCAESYNHECSQKLKLDAVIEYATGESDKRSSKIRNVKTCVLPCEVQSDTKFPNELRATMSVVLSPSKENSADGIDKLKTPVKLDASCTEVGWQTIEIAALPESEIGDVTLSLCKCTKTMHINCSVSQKQTVTNYSDKRDVKDKKLESKFVSDVNELGLFQRHCEKEIPKLPNHQMSITSYFQSPYQSSLHTLKTLAEDATESRSSLTLPQEENCFKSSDLTTTRKENVENSSKAPKESRESVVTQWKQILDRMRQKGQSSMSVTSDDSLTVISDGHTSAYSLYSSHQYSGKKTCPSYKRIPETSFVVDAFQYGIIPGISHYFLSHFHSDHYVGLRKSFSKPIYCSRITAALVKMKLRVDERYLNVLHLDAPQKINGVLVTALDANHCPGSVMFLFQLQDGRNFLHVGDFRADPKMESYPCFWNLTINKLYLDTTYCEPRYNFPIQSETIARVVELALEHHSRSPDTLFVCGTYTLGKEKVFLGIAEALNCKLWAQSDKRKILECINNQIINERLTNKQWEAQVHVCRMSDLNIDFLHKYLKQHRGVFTHIVAFMPTGWELRARNKSSDVNTNSYGNITIYGIPYSEHSSFSELRRFVQFLKPVEVIPTVNMEHATKRNAMMKHVNQWLSESPVASLKRKSEGERRVQQKMARYFNASKGKDV